MTIHTLTVTPNSCLTYDIVIAGGVLDELGPRLKRLASSDKAFLVFDDKLPADLVGRARTSLANAGFTVQTAALTAVEQRKTLDVTASLLHAMAAAGQQRDDPVIALGGGLTGDVAGFAAACYKRGCPLVQCPTTLLAMVDAAIGGKTGVNLLLKDGLRKNLIGAFHHPMLVLADLQTLDSLPDREFRAGLGECLKHGLIAEPVDAGLFQWTVEQMPAILAREPEVLAELIGRNVRVKAHYVEADERERDASSSSSRMMLNLGHTFAHALEAVTAPVRFTTTPDNQTEGGMLHGEAVAYGLIAAAAAALAAGRLPQADLARIQAAVAALGLGLPLTGSFARENLLSAMRHDKKIRQGKLHLVLPITIGKCIIHQETSDEVIQAGLTALGC